MFKHEAITSAATLEKLTSKNLRGKEKMTKNDKNVTRNYLEQLKKENEQLKKDNQVLGNELTYFKELSADYEEEINGLKNRCRSIHKRNMQLESEIADMRFTRKYLTGEEAGAKFAQELLGGA